MRFRFLVNGDNRVPANGAGDRPSVSPGAGRGILFKAGRRLRRLPAMAGGIANQNHYK